LFLALVGEAGGEPQAWVPESLSIVTRREDSRMRESVDNVHSAVKALKPLMAMDCA